MLFLVDICLRFLGRRPLAWFEPRSSRRLGLDVPIVYLVTVADRVTSTKIFLIEEGVKVPDIVLSRSQTTRVTFALDVVCSL